MQVTLNTRAHAKATKAVSKQAAAAAADVKRITVHLGLLIEKCSKFRNGVMEVRAQNRLAAHTAR
eukprot:2983356-Pyramimonas_sp.AAC.1